MVELRRLDTLLEPTKDAVLASIKFRLDEMQAAELDDAPLIAESGYVFEELIRKFNEDNNE